MANRRITNRILNSAFASFGRDPFRDPFFPFDTRALGIWFFNPRVGCYTFLPFYLGFGSPYGSSYTNAFYVPWRPAGNPSAGAGGYPPATTGSNGGYPASGSGSSNGGSSNGGGGYRPPTPPPASSGGFGNGGNGGLGREPRMINPETGNPAPRKNLEKMPGQP